MLCSRKLSVEAVCGTYYWICHWDILFDNVHHSNSSYEANGGFLTLSVKPGCNASPENIQGSIRIWSQNGSFDSMIACPVANNWDFDVTWEGGAQMKKEDGHGIEVLDVLDDQGDYFLMFLFDGGSIRGCGQRYSKFIGKRWKNENSERYLTQGEWERLAMHLTFDEAEDLWMNQPGSDGERSTGQATTGSETGEMEDEDEETISIQITAVGMKRKAEDEGLNGNLMRKLARNVSS